MVSYGVNYNYITQELCENKAKPELHCNGKCHLAKELAKTSEKDNPLESKRGLVNDIELLFFQELNNFSFTHYFQPTEKNTVYYTNFYGFIAVKSFFHPPSL